jgi:hypothetical protein
MSYTKATNFTAKDSLALNDPGKYVKGSDFDTEFDAIAVADALNVKTTALGTGVETFLGTPSSANLAAAVTGETGSGALVFATSPNLVTPALGTPSSGVLTNCTGTAAGLTAGVASAVAVGGITGLGTGVATALAVNVGTAGAPVVNGGALGTPASGTLTNCTGYPMPFSVSFVSSGQTITSGGALTIAHSLGAKPKLVTAYLVCGTGELGYSAGDELIVTVGSDETYSLGHSFALTRNATNLEVRFGSDANVFAMPRKDTGARTNLTNANWTIVFQAYA